MEKKISENIYYYHFNLDNYNAGKEYGKLILKREFNLDIINNIYVKHWEYLNANNSSLILKLLKKKLKDWTKLIEEKYLNLIQFEKGLSDVLMIPVSKIIELQILGELSGIFCTIYADVEKNMFYRILDTNISNRELLQHIYSELHVVNINGNITFGNPIYLVNHTFLSKKFSFATFGNNLLDKKKYLKNDLPFYYKLKIYLESSKNEYELIDKINKDTEIYYDVEIIIKGNNECFHIDVMNPTKNKKGLNIERSDYSPINLDDFQTLHKSLPDFNRIFIIYYKEDKLYFNNSLISNDFFEVKI